MTLKWTIANGVWVQVVVVAFRADGKWIERVVEQRRRRDG